MADDLRSWLSKVEAMGEVEHIDGADWDEEIGALTDLNRKMWEPPEMHQWLAGVQANPRLGTPEDIAGLSVFLCGPAADYMTGQVIASDGGYTVSARWPLEA